MNIQPGIILKTKREIFVEIYKAADAYTIPENSLVTVIDISNSLAMTTLRFFWNNQQFQYLVSDTFGFERSIIIDFTTLPL